MTKTLIITGANGWLGRGLISRFDGVGLNEYANVIAIVKTPNEKELLANFFQKTDIKIIVCDIGNTAEVERNLSFPNNSDLIHTAGVIHPKRVSEFHQTNVRGTQNVLNVARKSGVEKVAVLSSNSVHGVSRHRDCVFNEESKLSPYMNYGKSKFFMENVVQNSAKEFEQVSIIRAPWFYGPQQPLRQTQFFSMIKNGRFPLFGRADNLRSMVYIDNLVDGLLLSMKPREDNLDCFWIADARPYSMLEIVRTVEDVLSTEFDFKVKKNSIFLPDFVPQLAELADFLLQKIGGYNQKIHVLSEMNKTIACDISKASRVLGYKPRMSLYEGMRESVNWVINQGIRL